MGVWKEIKYALNSTLGTSKFKPLNKIIENAISPKSTLISSKDIDDKYYVFFNEERKTNDVEQFYEKKMNMKSFGSFTVYAYGLASVINIYINGELFNSFRVGEGQSRASNALSVPFSVGDEITIGYYSDSWLSNVSINYMYMLAKRTDGSFLPWK